MVNALDYDVNRELCARMAGLYNFIYRKLVEASVERDPKPAEEALGVIEYQRQTWMLLMDRLRQERAGQAPAATPSSAAVAAASVSRREPTEEATYGTLCVEG